jgi:hypothetical protein
MAGKSIHCKGAGGRYVLSTAGRRVDARSAEVAAYVSMVGGKG